MAPEDALQSEGSENRQLRAQLAEFERAKKHLELLEAIADSNQDLIAAQDTEFRYLAFNAAYRRETKRVFGADVEIGSSMVDALAHLPADQEKAVALWSRALGGEAFTITEMFQGIGEPKYFEGHWRPLRDREGTIIGACHIVREVTDRVRTENALRQREQQLRTLAAVVENSREFIGLATPELNPLFLNEAGCRLVGLAAAEVSRTKILDYIWPEDRAFAEKQALPTLLREGYWSGEIRFRHFKSGAPLDVHWNLFQIRDPAGELIAWATVSQNIGAHKRLEEELRAAKSIAEEANRAKSEFLASMSHEIRTPMTVFLVALEHLLDIDDDPGRRELLGLAENSARKLRALIDDILDFSRIEARRTNLQEVPFDLAAWLREGVELFALPAGEKQLSLTVEIAADVPPLVIGDPDRLGQVLTNLLGNAVKFTDQGGITISATVAGSSLRLAVADTGIGIPEEKRGQLFGLFAQLDPARTRKYGGTGLGLAICKGLVELMGGTIAMQPRSGGGSIFTVAVPLQVPDAAAAGESTGARRD